jgi:type I restriction enzyme S subunit
MAKAKKDKMTLEDALVPVGEQPYKVPENWCWTRLESVCDFERGITFPASAKETAPTNLNIPCIRTANIQEELELDDLLYVDKSYMKGNSNKMVRVDDIMMSSANSRELVGKTSYIHSLNNSMTFGGFVLCIRAKKIVPKYLFYNLRYEFLSGNFMKEATQTTNIANINTATLSKYLISLPPLAEQQRIVDQIENLFSKLDEAKEKAQSALEGFIVRKASILHDAFSGKLSRHWREDNQKNEQWIDTTLGDLADIKSSKRVYKEDYVDEGVPFFRSTEVVELYDYGVTTPSMFITREKYEDIKREKGIPKAGNLLVTSVGTIGKTWIVDDREFYYKDGNLTEVEQCEKLDMRFLQYYIMSEEFNSQVTDSVSGSAYNALTIVKFKKIKILLPSIEEQIYIVNVLDNLLNDESNSRTIVEKVLDQIDLMKKSILAKAFRGELGTNNPEEESSIELLKDILANQ